MRTDWFPSPDGEGEFDSFEMGNGYQGPGNSFSSQTTTITSNLNSEDHFEQESYYSYDSYDPENDINSSSLHIWGESNSDFSSITSPDGTSYVGSNDYSYDQILLSILGVNYAGHSFGYGNNEEFTPVFAITNYNPLFNPNQSRPTTLAAFGNYHSGWNSPGGYPGQEGENGGYTSTGGEEEGNGGGGDDDGDGTFTDGNTQGNPGNGSGSGGGGSIERGSIEWNLLDVIGIIDNTNPFMAEWLRYKMKEHKTTFSFTAASYFDSYGYNLKGKKEGIYDNYEFYARRSKSNDFFAKSIIELLEDSNSWPGYDYLHWLKGRQVILSLDPNYNRIVNELNRLNSELQRTLIQGAAKAGIGGYETVKVIMTLPTGTFIADLAIEALNGELDPSQLLRILPLMKSNKINEIKVVTGNSVKKYTIDEIARGFNPKSTPIDVQTNHLLPVMQFKDLTNRSKEIVKQSDYTKTIKLPPGGIPVSTLIEASKYLNRELAVVQSLDGSLRLLIGEGTSLYASQFRFGDRTLIHTHPTILAPKESHFITDFTYKNAHGDYGVEAMVDWNGRITYFNHESINLKDPGDIFDSTGRIVIGKPIK